MVWLCHGEENEWGNNHFPAVLVKTQSFHNLKWSLLWGQPDSGIRPEWGVQEAVGGTSAFCKGPGQTRPSSRPWILSGGDWKEGRRRRAGLAKLPCAAEGLMQRGGRGQGEEMQLGAPGPTAGGSAARNSLLPLPCSRQVRNVTFCTRPPGMG